MQRVLLLVLFLMVLAVPVYAQDALSRAVSSLDINAGLRFEPGVGKNADTENQFYIGAGFKVPVAARAKFCADFDRDFVDRPDWHARAFLSFSPFGE